MADLAPPRPIARAVLAYVVFLNRLIDRVLPGEIAALQRSIGFAPAYTMRALLEHEIPAALEGRKRTAAEIAQEKGLDADALHRIMRYAALHGLLKLDRRGRFALTRTGRGMVSMKPWVLYLTERSTMDAWAGVTETVATGEPSFPAVHGESIWSYFAKNPREEKQFAAGMRKITEVDLPSIVAGYPWPDTGTVCDVAGGAGTVLAGVLQKRPNLKGILVEAAGVLEEADGHLRAKGVRDRVELSEGDMFEHVGARADVYVMKDVLHDWDDERCRQILRTVRAAMPAGSKLVLVETLQEPNAVEPVASFVDVHMLTQTDGGRQRSADELHDLMRDRRPDARQGAADRQPRAGRRGGGMRSGVERQTEVYRGGVSGKRPRVPADATQLEERARTALAPEAFAYIAGGAGTGATMRFNREGFDRHRIVPRMLRDVSERDTSIELLGHTLPEPAADVPDRRPRDGPRRRRPRGRAGGEGRSGADDRLQPGVDADGGDRQGARRRAVVVPALLEHVRRARRVARHPRRERGRAGHRRHARHDAARLAVARPRRRLPPLPQGQGHRAVHERPGVPEDRRERRRRAAGRRDPRPPPRRSRRSSS